MRGQSRPTVLIVDDDDQTRSFVSRTLAAADFAVLEARGGLEGISAMLRHKGEIAVAVVELKLPRISGLDLANQIGVERPTTEILYISALTDSVAAESIAKAKPEAMLGKPFTARQLLNRVQKLVAA